MTKAPWILGMLEANTGSKAAPIHIGMLTGISSRRYNELVTAISKFSIGTKDLTEFDAKIMPFIESLHLNNTESLIVGAIVGVMYAADGCLVYGKEFARLSNIDYDMFLAEMKKCPHAGINDE